MKCTKPGCVGTLTKFDVKCHACGWTIEQIYEGKAAAHAKTAAMSTTDQLLLQILESSKESAFVLKRFLFAAKVFAAIWLISLAIGLIVALNN